MSEAARPVWFASIIGMAKIIYIKFASGEAEKAAYKTQNPLRVLGLKITSLFLPASMDTPSNAVLPGTSQALGPNCLD